MPHLPRERGLLVIVTWEPVMHYVATDTQLSWIIEHYHTVATGWTQCGQSITGYIDDGDKHVVMCLTCIGAPWDFRE